MIKINLKSYSVIKDDKTYELSPNDFIILKVLSGNNKVSIDELSMWLYGKYDNEGKSKFNPYYHAVCSAVCRLKKKMKLNIVNYREFGYMLFDDVYIE